MSIAQEIDNILSKDPAASSRLEVFLCYPGLHAILVYRLSHALWRAGSPPLRLLARFVSTLSRFVTGIEIHPGARLGRRLFIDHGTGVVIGETAEVGDDVVLYQGVTLGAQAAARMGALSRGKKRHPTLGNGVVVGSGAQILGGITLGNGVQVASGSILLKDVPDNCVVVGVPGRIIFRDGQRVADEIPDPEAEAIKALHNRVKTLERQLHQLMSLSQAPAIQFDFSAEGAPCTSASGASPQEQPESCPCAAGQMTWPAMASTPPVVSSAPLSIAGDPVDNFLHGAGI